MNEIVIDEEYYVVRVGKCYVKTASIGANISATTMRMRPDECTRYKQAGFEDAAKLADMLGGTVVKIKLTLAVIL